MNPYSERSFYHFLSCAVLDFEEKVSITDKPFCLFYSTLFFKTCTLFLLSNMKVKIGERFNLRNFWKGIFEARSPKFIKTSPCITFLLSEWSDPKLIEIIQSLNPGFFIDIDSY